MSYHRRRPPKCAVCGCEITALDDQFRRKFALPGKPEIAWCGQHKDDADKINPLMAAAEPDELIVLLDAIEARGPERVIRRRKAVALCSEVTSAVERYRNGGADHG